MRRFSPAVCLLALHLAAACSGATPDANGKSDAPADPRLEQKVTAKAIGEPLGDFLGDLSENTGVKMTARKDVADDKLAVFVKNLALSELQHAIKQVLHLQCTRKGKVGEWKYEFWMDLKTKQEIERLKQEDVQKLKDHMEELVEALKLSPQEVEKKFEDDAVRRTLKHQVSRSFLGAYQRWSDTLWRAGKLCLSAQDLPSGLQSQSSAFQFIRMELAVEEGDFGSGLCLRCTYCASEAGNGTLYLQGGSILFLPVHDQETDDFEGSETEGQRDGHANGESVGKTDAELVKLEIDKPLTIYRLLEKIAENTNASYVSDYFTCLTSSKWSSKDFPEAEPLDKLFSRIGFPKICRIKRKGSTYMLSHKHWFRNREREIPERFVTRWERIIKEHGGLGIWEAMELSRLNERQLQDLPLYGLGGGETILRDRGFLRFLDTLTSRQWEAVMSEDGLPVSQIRQEQYKLLSAWLESKQMQREALLQQLLSSTSGTMADHGDIQGVAVSSHQFIANERNVEEWDLKVHGEDGSTIARETLCTPLMRRVDAAAKKADTDSESEMLIEVTGNPSK